MAEEGGGEGQSKAQGIARTVGVTIRLVNQTRKEVEGIVGVMERVKKLFTSTEKVAQTSGAQTSAATSSIAQRISSLGQVASGGGGGAIAAMMGGVGGAVMGAVGAVQNFGSSIASIHQGTEDMTNTLAGTFAALGLATNIDDGASRATAALASINTAAARLPGEASEYITVFQSAVSSLAGSFDNDLDHMLAFSNQFSAVGRSLGIDAEQIGRDMNLMMRGGQAGAGADVATFQRMLPFINAYRTGVHQAAVTAQTFNRMTQVQRRELLEATVNGRGLLSMTERAANTYSAISGEFAGHMTTIKSAITAPFFDALKQSMKAMNTLLSRYEGTIKSVGARIATFMVTTSGKFADSLAPLFREGGPLMTSVGALQRRAGLVWDDISHGGSGNNMALGAGGVAAGAALGGPVMGLLVAGFASFMQHTEAVGAVMRSLVGVGDGLMMILYQITGIFGDLGAGLGNGLAIVLPMVAQAFSQIVQGLGVFFGYMSTLVSMVQDDLGPSFTMLAGGLRDLFAGIANFVGPAFRFFGMALLDAWRQVREYVMPAFRWLASGITHVMEAIGALLTRMGRGLTAVNNRNAAFDDAGNDANDPVARALARLAHIGEAAPAANAAAAARANPRAPGARGGNHTHNDFRGSNFDITQKFAEGFDPDRIAAGFVSDLESAATNRIQGGFEPLFSIR